MNGPHHSNSPCYRFSDVIPECYKEPILLVLPCNPFRLYVYWEHPAITADAASTWSLRYYADESSPAQSGSRHDCPEISISSSHGERFLDVTLPGAQYTVELVQVNADGASMLLLQSGHRVPATAADTHTSTFTCRSTDGLISAPDTAKNTRPGDMPADAHPDSVSVPPPVPGHSLSSWALQPPPAS